MKTKIKKPELKSMLIAFSLLAVLSCFFIISCKKDRINSPPPADTYSSMNAFYNKYQQQEQDYQIDSGGVCPLICKMGTKICAGADLFEYSNSQAVHYPFHLKVMEIYPVKDIILNKLPNVAGGNILEAAAQIRVRAVRDNQDLHLKTGNKYYMELDTMINPANYTEVYEGVNNGTYVDWVIDNQSQIGANAYFDTLHVAKLGWTQSAKAHNSGAKTTITVLPPSGSSGAEFIDVYFVFKNFKSVMQVYYNTSSGNFISGQVPVGEPITVIAMALNQKNEYVLHKEDIAVSAGQQITLNMQVISESNLLGMLSGL
jgi:hypothetical protein